MEAVRRVSAPPDRVAVIGAGASALISDLVDHGYQSIDAVDISAAALGQLRTLLGERAGVVRFVHSDVRTVEFDAPVDVWHDRATFHFLTDPADQMAYAARAAAAVRAGGHLVIAVFSLTGPEQCSGLPVVRYSADELAAVFDADFTLVEASEYDHVTPWGDAQSFVQVVLRRSATTTPNNGGLEPTALAEDHEQGTRKHHDDPLTR